MTIEKLLNGFPKKRDELPLAYKVIYENEYLRNRGNEGLINQIKTRLEGWMHKQCAIFSGSNILEIGAGTLNHVLYENNYKTYDIVEPNHFLYSKSSNIELIQNKFCAIQDIDKNLQYDKIFSIAVFEHIENLPCEIARLALKLKEDGQMSVAIPSEGGFLWGLSWRISTGISFFLRYKLKYKTLMHYEHINEQQEIIALMSYFFKDVKVKAFPFTLKHLSLYTYIEAKNPNIDICERYNATHS